MSRQKLPSFLTLLLFPALFLLLFSGCLFLNNRAFSDYTDEIFKSELAANTLSLHYTLKNPEQFGLTNTPVTLGSAEPAVLAASSAVLENYSEALSRFPYPVLSKENRLTYDILKLYFENQMEGAPFALYAEPLGPSIGTQAQLPVLLAEYAFYDKEDIETYLKLLETTDDYFASLVHFEEAKSKAGLFMSASSAEAILEQCRSFIEQPEENLLIAIFSEKMKNADFLTQAEKSSFEEANAKAVLNHVIPAYRLLIQGLSALKDTGKNQQGLAYFPKGREYYAYLLRDSTGSYASVPDIEKRILSQIRQDFSALQLLVKKHPELLSQETLGSAIAFTVDNSPATIFNTDHWYSNAPHTKARAKKALESLTPAEILDDLKAKIAEDFPLPPEVTCSVKYVHESLEPYLSPAFYLTPPIDDLFENVIYINQGAAYSPLDLYTTLAHEGYPGHLYQTTYSGVSGKNPVRELLNFGGYVEGWATYVEMYSYSLADIDPNLSKLYRLNRSLTLALSSLMDIAVHYRGFSREQTAAYLADFGFEAASANALYDALLEAPANYLKYYLGYLSFLDLKAACQKEQGSGFSLKKFHQEILEIGPAPFPILSKYMLDS